MEAWKKKFWIIRDLQAQKEGHVVVAKEDDADAKVEPPKTEAEAVCMSAAWGGLKGVDTGLSGTLVLPGLCPNEKK